MIKWIGQHIVDLVARFRSDVYFENLSETEETRGLVVDANGKVSINPLSGDEHATHIYENVRNDEGATIPVGTPVYSKGEVGGSERILVGVADAADPNKMPAIGITNTELTTTGDTKDGLITLVGVYNTNLSGFTGVSVNDIVYVAERGGLTITKPTGTLLIQNVGIVLKTNGTIIQGLQVTCIGRTNDVPTPLYIDHANQRVGIGATSPGNKLEVHSGTTNVAAVFKSGDNQAWISVQDDDSGTYGALFGTDSDAGHHIVLADRSANKRLVVDSSGNVGIGTDSPGQKLEVDEGYINVTGAGTTHGYELERDGLDTYRIRHLDGGLTIQNSTDSRKEMTFDGDGNVGIGTTSPSQKLDVNGSVAADTFASIQGVDTGNPNAGTDELRVSGYGILGNRSSGVYVTNENASGKLFFGVGDKHALATRMTIDSSGNVGINTTTPSSQLHVNGAVKIAGKITNVTDPTAAQDAATKNYVDSEVSSVPVVIHQFMGYLPSFTSGNYYYGHNTYGPYHHVWTNNLASEPTTMNDFGASRHGLFLHIVPADLKNIGIKAYVQNGLSSTNSVTIKVYKTTRPDGIAANNATLGTAILSASTGSMTHNTRGFNADDTSTDTVSAGEALVLVVIPSGSSTDIRFNYTLYGFTN